MVDPGHNDQDHDQDDLKQKAVRYPLRHIHAAEDAADAGDVTSQAEWFRHHVELGTEYAAIRDRIPHDDVAQYIHELEEENDELHQRTAQLENRRTELENKIQALTREEREIVKADTDLEERVEELESGVPGPDSGALARLKWLLGR